MFLGCLVALSLRIIRFNNVDHQALNDIAEFVRAAFSVGVRFSQGGLVPIEFVDVLRNQYRAEDLLQWVYSKWGGKEVVLALIEGDGYAGSLNFVFGIASPLLKVALVFTSRLKLWIKSGMSPEQLFIERLRKEVMHELGHVFGLGHCSNPHCVMFFSNSIFDTDRKSWKYCSACASKLRFSGVSLSREFIL